jgi:hypothetical protein
MEERLRLYLTDAEHALMAGTSVLAAAILVIGVCFGLFMECGGFNFVGHATISSVSNRFHIYEE